MSCLRFSCAFTLPMKLTLPMPPRCTSRPQLGFNSLVAWCHGDFFVLVNLSSGGIRMKNSKKMRDTWWWFYYVLVYSSSVIMLNIRLILTFCLHFIKPHIKYKMLIELLVQSDWFSIRFLHLVEDLIVNHYHNIIWYFQTASGLEKFWWMPLGLLSIICVDPIFDSR